MESLQLAQAIRDLAGVNESAELAGVFLRATVEAHGLTAGFCYWTEATGQSLYPLASVGEGVRDLPSIPLSELDNPLVYGLLSAHRYQIDDIGSLVDVGESFEKVCVHLPARQVMHITPLRELNGRPMGLVALVGVSSTIGRWNASSPWQLLMQAYEQLHMRMVKWDGHVAKTGRESVAVLRDNERGRARASRLLAAGFVGVSAVAKALRNDMLRLSDSSLSLLITGETGTGKDHAAWLIHQASSREGNFIPVNCAAIPKDLIEAELFGVVRGAYTGATHARAGLVAEANGGTLFLDEIGDMPLGLQGTLLRLLNEKRYRPVGATREQDSDFRLICATHRSLPALVHSGLFREDLYFRICQQVLHLPPLRERTEDIPALVSHILLQFNREHQNNVTGLSERAMTLLRSYPFQGNIRELRSLVQVAAEQAGPSRIIRCSALSRAQEASLQLLNPEQGGTLLQDLWHTKNLPQALEQFEQCLVRDRLQKSDGSRRLAAQSLGIPKRTLARKCQTWNLDVEHSTT
ncbi:MULTISPECIES: sigma 54-interacting transcriptional regulator [Pseudomonas]|uniref:sigma 54-interacting transcriptional regulator n=1 Tax=Pseudomonas TaxID=286 RepID=UPI0023627D3B|nr:MULTISPECIES: sigma-54 dependent transcriptional regulator [Pseudomonas]WJV25571.1 sigma-54 dependent transcriptional regulator [Pseudomonas chlororaphis]